MSQEKINESHYMGNTWVLPSTSRSTGNAAKRIVWGESGKLVLIPFHFRKFSNVFILHILIQSIR